MVCPNLESSFQGQSEAKQFQIKNDNCSNRAERQLAYSQSHKVLLAKLLVGTNTRLVELEYYFLSLLIG